MLTYNFISVVLDATDYQVHVLVEIAATLGHNIHLQRLILSQCGTLEVKGRIVVIHDLHQAAVFFIFLVSLNLNAEVLIHVVRHYAQLVGLSHYHNRFFRLQSHLSKMTALVIEQTVTVATPSDSFHKDADRSVNSTLTRES